MKVSVVEKILDYEGKPLIKPKGENRKCPKCDHSWVTSENKEDEPILWREIIHVAMNTPSRDEKMTGELSTKLYQITKKAFDTNEPDYTVDQLALIIERIKKTYNPLIAGRAEEYFNKIEEKKEEK